MSRRGLVLVLFVLAVVGGLPPATGSDTAAQAVAGPAAVRAPQASLDDPFPILRIRTTETHLPELLKQIDAGPVIRLGRADFEHRLRMAAKAAANARVVPRIIDIRLKAALIGGDVVGTGEIDIANPATSPRFMSLGPLRLALGEVKWSDGREGILGIPPGGTGPELWVEPSERQTLRFTWSLAGMPELGERRFELRTPVSATASLILDLPSDQIPSASSAEALLAGPLKSDDNPPRSEWSFRFGGRGRLDFAVRPRLSPGVIALASLVATYDVGSGQLSCSFEYDLRPAKGSVSEWAFLVDPSLSVTDVVVNNRAGWSIDPPPAAGGPRRLRVALHQPGAGGKVRISAVAPFPIPARPADSPLPTILPVNANLEDESVEIRIAPGLKLVKWQPGDYRLSNSQLLADQTRVLSLVGTLLPAAANRSERRMPALRVSELDVDFSTQEQIDWRFGPDRVTAKVRITVRVRRGVLFQLALQTPPGYSAPRVSGAPDDLAAHTSTGPGAVSIEFMRPLSSGQVAELTIELTGSPLATAPLTLPFPSFGISGVTERVGTLSITAGPLWTIVPVPGTGATPAAWFDFSEPKAVPGASVSYRYRGLTPDGFVRVDRARAEFSADVSTRTSEAGGLASRTTFDLQVRSGGLSSLVLIERTPSEGKRSWRVIGGGNAVAAALVLPVITLPGPIGVPAGWPGPIAAYAAGKPAPRIWLIKLAHPAARSVTLETIANRGSPSGQSERSAEESESSAWLVPGSTPDPDTTQLPSTDGPSVQPARAWSFSEMYLVTAVRSTSDVLMVFGGRVDSQAGRALPIRLPPGARLHSASIAGRWLGPGSCRVGNNNELSLPVNSTGTARFEVRYSLPVASDGPIARIRSPEPALPVEGVAVPRWWTFASNVLPGWPIQAWDSDHDPAMPKLLGEPPMTTSGGLFTSRAPIEEVRVGSTRVAIAIGITLAAVLIGLAWTGGRRRHPVYGLIMIGSVLVLGGASLVGPPWWQRATLLPLIVGLAGLAAVIAARSQVGVSAVPAAAAVLLCMHVNSKAQSGTPATVILLPPDAEGREQVVVPRDVLERLVVPPPSRGVILTASHYSVVASDSGARVVARFTVHSLGHGEAMVTLPLAEARLERVTVNKAAAFPSAPRPGVYTVGLPGHGRHEIEAAFAVQLGGTGPEREIRFGIPECPVTHLAADLPGSARQAQVVGRVGRRTAVDGDRVKLDVDVGPARTMQVRWREGAAGTSSIKVREGGIWDVSEAGARLTTCYLVRVEQGTIASLNFDVPAGLDVLAVATRSLDAAGSASLRNWTRGAEKGPSHPLRIDFQGPTGGRLLVVLTCAPRRPISRQPILRFPKLTIQAADEQPDAAYGLRLNGLTLDDLGRSGVIDFSPDALTAGEFGKLPELWREPSLPVRVFRPTPTGAPELRPTLQVTTDPVVATLETTWQIGPKRADGTGVIHWLGKDPVEMVEFLLPGVKVIEVLGTEVSHWSQDGSGVQVWLRRSTREGEIEWTGMCAPAGPFESVTPRVAGMRLGTDLVRVQGVGGFAPRLVRDNGWTMIEESRQTRDEITLRTTNGNLQPAQVVLTKSPKTATLEEFGWVGSHTRAQPRLASPVSSPSPSRVSVESSPAAPAWDLPRSTWPVFAGVAWILATAALAILMVHFSTSTWPEQLGIVAGLLGSSLLDSWWIGVFVWLVARLVLRFENLLNRRPALIGRQ